MIVMWYHCPKVCSSLINNRVLQKGRKGWWGGTPPHIQHVTYLIHIKDGTRTVFSNEKVQVSHSLINVVIRLDLFETLVHLTS